MKTVIGWAILSDCPYQLQTWGNGYEFQYPIFPSKDAALDWARRHGLNPLRPRLKKVKITIWK